METLTVFFLLGCCACLGKTIPSREYPVEYNIYLVSPNLEMEDRTDEPLTPNTNPEMVTTQPVIHIEAEKQNRLKRKTDVPEQDGEVMQTEGFSEGESSSKDNIGFRPSHAYVAARYHKYPWNYH